MYEAVKTYRAGKFVIVTLEAYYSIYFADYVAAEFNNSHHLIVAIIDYYHRADRRVAYLKNMRHDILKIYPRDGVYMHALISEYLRTQVRIVKCTPHQQVSTFIYRQIGLTANESNKLADKHLAAGHSAREVIVYLASHIIPLIE